MSFDTKQQLTTEQLQQTLDWCKEREASKPHYTEMGDSPKCLVKCDYMIALITEVLAVRQIEEIPVVHQPKDGGHLGLHASLSPGPVNCNIRNQYHGATTWTRTCERCGKNKCPFFYENGSPKDL